MTSFLLGWEAIIVRELGTRQKTFLGQFLQPDDLKAPHPGMVQSMTGFTDSLAQPNNGVAAAVNTQLQQIAVTSNTDFRLLRLCDKRVLKIAPHPSAR